MMRWHCIVRGKVCKRDIPGQGTHGGILAAAGRWSMADDVLEEYNDGLGGNGFARCLELRLSARQRGLSIWWAV